MHGTGRLEGVTVTQVDGQMRPVAGTERYIPCDTLILSVGLIPENDILDGLAPKIDARTKGPQVNQYMGTTVPGLFSCVNALHVNDLVDYVSESGSIAGEQAAILCNGKRTSTGHTREDSQQDKAAEPSECLAEIPIGTDKTLLYQTPARIVPDRKPAVIYFRSAAQREHATLTINAETADGTTVLFKKTYRSLKPPEMERIVLDTASIPAHTERLLFSLENAEAPHRSKEET